MRTPHWYRAADVISGALLGATIALIEPFLGLGMLPWIVRLAVAMFGAMVAQAVFAIVVGALLGNVELAVPGFITAMIAMFAPEFATVAWQQAALGAMIGANVFLLFEIWDLSLQGHQFDARETDEALWALPTNVRAWWYDFRQRGGNHRRAWIQRCLLLAAKGDVLLAGAGTGLNLLHFPKRECMTITAVDMDMSLLSRATRRGRELGLKVKCLPGNVESLPFPENTFDTVVSIATLCSVGSPSAALTEYKRVLKPNGTLLLFEHVRSTHTIVGAFMSLMDLVRLRTSSSMSRQTLRDVRRAGFMVTNAICGYADIYLAVIAVNLSKEVINKRETRPRLDAAV